MHDLRRVLEMQWQTGYVQPTFCIKIMPLYDVLAQVADEAIHEKRIALDFGVAVPIDQREKRVRG